MKTTNIQSKKSGVYCLWSKAKGHAVYVGSTCNLIRRRSQHRYCCKNSAHSSTQIIRHCDAFGADDLIFKVLEYCAKSELAQKEADYVKSLKTHVDEGGCNTRLTVESNAGIKRSVEPWNKGKVMTDAYRQTISETTRLAMSNPEIRAKLSAAKKGKPVQRLGKKTNKPAHNVKAISATNLSTRKTTHYPSLKIAASSLNLNFSSISAACLRANKVHRGYEFRYQDQ